MSTQPPDDPRDPCIGARVPPELLARLDALAARQGWTRSQAIRWCLDYALRAEGRTREPPPA